MKIQLRIAGIVSSVLMAGFLVIQPLQAQQNSPQPTQQPAAATAQPQQQPAQTNSLPADQATPVNPSAAPATQNQQSQPQQNAPNGTTVNPSQGPLQPVTTYPDASGAAQQQEPQTAPATVPEAPQPKRQQSTEPVGAAAAERVPTAGGAAAKPAGVAIAPAKQHQTRSLLIKLGAVAAAGAALGAVFALSHSTSSTPPGATTAGVTAR